MLTKLYAIQKFAGAESSARTVVVRISDGSVDRQGDIVVQAGIDTANFFKTGGTVLWGHDAEQPVAKCLSISRVGDATQATVTFPAPGVSAKADEVYGLIKADIINSSSIGFRPIQSEPIDPQQPHRGRRFLKCELCEFSFVSVPANTGATIIQRSGGSREATLAKLKAALNTCEAHHVNALDALDAVDGGETTAAKAMAPLRESIRKANHHARNAARLAGELAQLPGASSDDTELAYGGARKVASLAALDQADVGRAPPPETRGLGGAHLTAQVREEEEARLRALWR
jgi:HK97 family phage prohead protease